MIAYVLVSLLLKQYREYVDHYAPAWGYLLPSGAFPSQKSLRGIDFALGQKRGSSFMLTLGQCSQ